MKKTGQVYLHGLVASAVALGAMMLAVCANAESVPQVVQILKVEGNAQYSTDGKTWLALHKGDLLQQGAVIRTAEKSLVDVLFCDKDASTASSKVSLPNYPAGSAGGGGGGGGGGEGGGNKPSAATANIVRIFESTVLGVDKLVVERTGVDEVAETELDLRAGQIMGNVKKLSANSHYEIKIPNGVAGIRGTSFLVSSSGKVFCLDGSVIAVVINPDGTTVKATVNAGQMFDPSTYDSTHPEIPPATQPIPPALYQDLQAQMTSMPSTETVHQEFAQADETIVFLSPVNGTTPR